MSKKTLILTLLLFAGFAFAQQPFKKEDLRKKSKALTEQIAKLNKSLNENRSGSTKSLLYIKTLEEKIGAQDELVRISAREKKVLEDEIYLSQLDINKLKRELTELKKEYKDVLVNAYKNKGLQNKVLFVLSSKSFTEAFRRIKYIERYSGYQGEKADEISEKRRDIEATIAKREGAMKEKDAVMAKQQVLKDNLEVEKQQQNVILADFRKNEGSIRNEIASKQSENKKLENEIQRIIAEEIRIAKAKEEAERKAREEAARIERERLAKLEAERVRLAKLEAERVAKEKADREKALAAGKPAPEPTKPIVVPEKPKETVVVETSSSESAALASSFVANKGSLPMPVNGKVVGRFGRQPHITLPNITENHAGVLIAANSGSTAKSVFNGTVQAVMAPPSGNYAVIINHGSYFTVYNNLSSVSVSKGQKVTTRQELGRIYTDSENNTILDFQVWNGTTKVDPAPWIAGM